MLLRRAGRIGAARAVLVALAFAPCMAAVWLGCFYDVDDVTPSGGGATGATSGAATAGATGETTATGAATAGTGGIMRLACTIPDAGCDGACPAGSACVSGCCDIDAAPPDCASAIDVTAGGRFHATVCGGPLPTSSPFCGPTSPYLLLRVGQSSGDAGTFAITADKNDEPHLGIALPCGGERCEGTPPWFVDAGTTFAFQTTAEDPCVYFVFDVTPQ